MEKDNTLLSLKNLEIFMKYGLIHVQIIEGKSCIILLQK